MMHRQVFVFFMEDKKMFWSKRSDLQVLNGIILLFDCFNNGATQSSVNVIYIVIAIMML